MIQNAIDMNAYDSMKNIAQFTFTFIALLPEKEKCKTLFQLQNKMIHGMIS